MESSTTYKNYKTILYQHWHLINYHDFVKLLEQAKQEGRLMAHEYKHLCRLADQYKVAFQLRKDK